MSDKLSPLGYDFFADVEGTRSVAHTLEAGVRFKTQLNALSRLEKNLAGLPARLEAMNERRVTVLRALAKDVAGQREQLKQVSAQTHEMVESYQQSLQPRVDALWQQIEHNDGLIRQDGYEAHGEAITSTKRQADQLKIEMEQAEQDILGCFNELTNKTRQLSQHITHLERACDALSRATFALHANEMLLNAIDGTYHISHKEAAEGVLFLTTQRLIFEQRQEVVTSRFFLFSQKQRVEEVRFAERLDQVSNIHIAQQQGRETFHLTLTKKANVREATFSLSHNAQQWANLINQVRLGEVEI